MLGCRLHDPHGLDGEGNGLGLLAVETTFEPEKLVRRRGVRFADSLSPAWQALAGSEAAGYEIRHGRTVASGDAAVAVPDEVGWVAGSVLGITVHGVLESPEVLRALFGRVPLHSLDSAIDALTDVVIASLDASVIDRAVGPPATSVQT
jgi:adenosylcobyric acid synthase